MRWDLGGKKPDLEAAGFLWQKAFKTAGRPIGRRANFSGLKYHTQ